MKMQLQPLTLQKLSSDLSCIETLSLPDLLTKDKKTERCPGGLDSMTGGVLRQQQFRKQGSSSIVND